MINLTSKEEAIKHLAHVKGTYAADIENPLHFEKGKYEFKAVYLGNVIYYVNTEPLDMTIDEFFKENNNV